MKEKPYFMLFACCPLVKGATRSIIYDLQRNKFKYIPNMLYDILVLTREHPIAQIKSMLDHEEDEGIDAYLEALAEEELGFFTDSPQEFPPLPLEWDYPGTISNAIIEYDDSSPYDLFDVIAELEALKCKQIQLRYFGTRSMEHLQALAKRVKGSFLFLLDVMVPYESQMTLDGVAQVLLSEHRIIPLMVYDCPAHLTEKIEHQTNFVKSRLITTAQHFESNQVPEHSDEHQMTVNTEFFTEAQHHNTGLNAKVCIDVDGQIKNHFFHRKVHGQVGKVKLEAVVNTTDFRNLWHIKNDNIRVCQDCEYRYMCLDNTEVVIDEEGYRKVKACAYDVYEGVWTS